MLRATEISGSLTTTSTIIERIEDIAYEIWNIGSVLRIGGNSPETGFWVWVVGDYLEEAGGFDGRRRLV
jgi:hypothetical protein